MSACITSPSCVAVDFGPVGCVLHHNVSDLATAYYAPGVTHLVLSRICQRTTQPSTESPLAWTTSVGNTTGKSDYRDYFLVFSTWLRAQNYAPAITRLVRSPIVNLQFH